MRTGALLRRALLSLLLLLGGLLSALVLAEGAVRILSPQILLEDPDAFDPDPILGGRLRPGFSGRFSSPEYDTRWEINGSGHRGAEPGPKAGGLTRVAALGDSFTFGYGVESEEAWPARLGPALARRAGRPVEVINLGIGGYGAAQEVAWLAERLEKGLAPDLVVLGFYPGNDLSDSVRGLAAVRALESGGAEAAIPGAAPPPPSRSMRARRWLGRRLQLYSFVSERADALLLRLGLRSVVYLEEIEVLRAPEPAAVASGWRAVEEALERLSALAQERGFAAVVAGIPMRHQVVPASWERVRRWHRDSTGEGLEGVDLDAPQRRLEEACANAGLEAIDLAPALREEPDPARLYFARDQHLTAAGHDRVASALADRLASSGIADEDLGGGPPVDADDRGRVGTGERPEVGRER